MSENEKDFSDAIWRLVCFLNSSCLYPGIEQHVGVLNL